MELFLTEEFQAKNVEGMMETENHHLENMSNYSFWLEPSNGC